MIEKLTAQYDSLYASTVGIMYGENDPIKPLTRLKNYLPAGTVLDVGGGEGRNALYLAQAGYDVTVSDISQVGLDKLKKFAQEGGVEITTQLSNVVTDGFDNTYDCFIFSYVLHHIDTADAARMLQQAKDHTTASGIHVIATFSNQGELAERNQRSPADRFYPSEATLREIYADWNIKELRSKETTSLAKRKDGTVMNNWFITLIAQKPQ